MRFAPKRNHSRARVAKPERTPLIHTGLQPVARVLEGETLPDSDFVTPLAALPPDVRRWLRLAGQL
jgi:hypothetical protein